MTWPLLFLYLVSTYFPNTWAGAGLCLTKEYIYTRALQNPSGQTERLLSSFNVQLLALSQNH